MSASKLWTAYPFILDLFPAEVSFERPIAVA
jgi:hypothetical protein